MTAGAGPAARAESLGIPALNVDGNDILAVDEAARRLIGDVRAGGGPRFLVCKTYRLCGHTGADPAAYRSKDELDAAWGRDPIARAEELLIGCGVERAELEAARAAARAESAAVFAAAAAAPSPSAQIALADVQDLGDPRREAY